MPYWNPDKPDELVTIADYHSLEAAISDRMLLESAGIAAFIADEHTARIAGPFHPVLGTKLRLQVAESEAEDAVRILKAPLTEEPGDGTV